MEFRFLPFPCSFSGIFAVAQLSTKASTLALPFSADSPFGISMVVRMDSRSPGTPSMSFAVCELSE